MESSKSNMIYEGQKDKFTNTIMGESIYGMTDSKRKENMIDFGITVDMYAKQLPKWKQTIIKMKQAGYSNTEIGKVVKRNKNTITSVLQTFYVWYREENGS